MPRSGAVDANPRHPVRATAGRLAAKGRRLGTLHPWRLERAIRKKRWRDPGVGWIVDQFHRIYYGADRRTWRNTFWQGVPVWKCAFDLWVYQEIVVEVRPDVIVESGTMYGGSAYYLASLCDLVGSGRVVTIDIEERAGRPEHPRITYVTGSSTDPEVLAQVDERIAPGSKVLVILDSDHSREHVLAELDAWHARVSVGSYLIVEDTNIHGHPVAAHRGPGPWEAVAEWLPAHPDFRPDPEREKFFVTFNPQGFLKRIA